MSEHSAEKDPRLIEWRDRIGERLMHAMTCTHEGETFGPRAVCATCFANVQRIGAIVESEREKALESLVAALKAAYPSINCELRYDGTEDPVMAAYVDAWREVDQIIEGAS